METTAWKSENWWVGNYNFSNEVRSALSLPKKVMIHDSTLRDGEQTPGVVFRKEDKVEIAKALDDVGVDRIETGMPAVSKEDQDAIRMISNLGLRAKIFTFCRATKGDIDLSVDCGADGVLIEIPCSTPKLKYQFKWDEQQVIDKSIQAILYAKERGVYVTYFPYDTTRSDMNFLKRLLGEVIKAGRPDSIGIVDTMGCMLPLAMAGLISEIKAEYDIPLEIHAHNDLGMGTANTLAAIGAGAEVAHVSVNGIGERSGNTALDEVVVGLRVLYGIESQIHFEKLKELSSTVERLSGFQLPVNKPIVGSNMFVRESGIGIEMVKKVPLSMFSLNPSFVGNQAGAVLGKKSGGAPIKTKLEELNIKVDEEKILEILEEVKARSIAKKGLIEDNEFMEIVKHFSPT